MNSVDSWIVIFGLMIVTFITRSFFLLMGSRMELSETVQNALRYAPAAALVAIIAPEIFIQQGSSDSLLTAPQLWGGIASFLAFLMTKSMFFTIILGMLAFALVGLIAS
jgi:branched-subunit amino acid transport protein